jgi:hypothetical protein
MLGPRREGEVRDDMTVWVVVAGKLRPDRQPVQRNLLQIGGESLEGLLQSAFESDLIRTYFVARSAGAAFRLAAVPQDFAGPTDPLAFDPEAMRGLFAEGERFAAAGEWQPQPPGVSPAEQRPRGGVRFETRGPEVSPK